MLGFDPVCPTCYLDRRLQVARTVGEHRGQVLPRMPGSGEKQRHAATRSQGDPDIKRPMRSAETPASSAGSESGDRVPTRLRTIRGTDDVPVADSNYNRNAS
jgi:hypothetical protein